MVERSPEKAGVGGSTPSLATTFSIVRSGDIGNRTLLPWHYLSSPFGPKSVTHVSGTFSYRKQSVPDHLAPVPASAWLYEKGLQEGAQIWEQSVGLKNYGAVLSLLMIVGAVEK